MPNGEEQNDEAYDSTVGLDVVKRADGTFGFNAVLRHCLEAVIDLEVTLTHMRGDRKFPLTACVDQQEVNIANIWEDGSGPGSQYKWAEHGQAGKIIRNVRHNHMYALPYQRNRFLLDTVYPPQTSRQLEYPIQNNTCLVSWLMPEGTVVCAAREGKVIAIRMDSTTGGINPWFIELDNYVVVKHTDHTYGCYRHLYTNTACVRLGQPVHVGQPLARSGKTGSTRFPRLAFQVYVPLDGSARRGFPIAFRTPDGKIVQTQPGQQYYL